MEFLSSSIAQLKVVQTKYVEAKDCLNVLNKSNEGEWDPPHPNWTRGGCAKSPEAGTLFSGFAGPGCSPKSLLPP